MEAITVSKQRSNAKPSSNGVFSAPRMGRAEETAFERIDELRSRLRFYVTEPRRWVGLVGRVLRAKAIRGSNSIEGFNVSVEDALAALESAEPSEAHSRDWNAVMGYRRAMTYVLQLADDQHFRYTPELIRGLHFMMTEYDLNASPGRWRPGPIWVRNDATGEIVYEGPDADQIPALIDGLVAQLEGDDGDHPMVRGAMAHLNLAMIHPFRDGNGRMARGLQTLVLVREAILAPEWCSIEEYLGRNTEAYYAILAEVGKGAWHPDRNAKPWVRFCLRAHYIQAASVLRRVQESEAMFSAVAEIQEKEHLHERTLPTLLDAAIGLRIRNASYRSNAHNWTDSEISPQAATNDLRTLVRLDLLEQHGAKRGTYYVGTKTLTEIRNRVRAGRKPIDASALFAT
jgi:Fic family protein